MKHTVGVGPTKRQIAAIHAACSAQGIRGQEYRDLLSRYGVTSSLTLTKAQASKLLDSLGLARQPPRRKRTRRSKRRSTRLPKGVVRLATGAQRQLIARLREELSWSRKDHAFEAWLVRFLKVEKVRTSDEAARVIEAMKAMRRR